MKMQKRQFRIGRLASYLNLEKFVIRFWEKEFAIKTSRSMGGQRFYDDHDIEKFLLIKELLYKRGFTIAGAKQQLKEQFKRKKNSPKVLASSKTTFDLNDHDSEELSKAQIEQQIIDLQKKLLKLRELL